VRNGKNCETAFLHGIINFSDWIKPYIVNSAYTGVTDYAQFIIYKCSDTGDVRIQARREVDRGR
jgi:hypothetical protein